MFNVISNFLAEKFRKKTYVRNKKAVNDEVDNDYYPTGEDATPLSEIIGMPVRELSPALQKIAEDELGEVSSRTPNDIKALKEWLLKQRHINANTSDQWILSFLRGCKFSLERTKEKIENFYTAKTLSPEIFLGVDPADKKFIKFFRLGTCVALEKPLSEDGVCLFLMRPGCYNPKEYSLSRLMQVYYMIMEIFMIENDNFNVAGIKLLADLENMSMRHFAQCTPVIIKKLVVFGEKGVPIRQKGVHNMNTPAGVETVFNMTKSLLNEKGKSRFFVHNKNYEELFKHVPKECLPTEFGGDTGPISNLVDFWEKKLLSYRNYFLEAREFRTEESLRLGKPKTLEDLYGVVGSFRTLSVD